MESGTALVTGDRECIGSREDKPSRGYFRIYIETMHEAMALGVLLLPHSSHFGLNVLIHQLSGISVQ